MFVKVIPKPEPILVALGLVLGFTALGFLPAVGGTAEAGGYAGRCSHQATQF